MLAPRAESPAPEPGYVAIPRRTRAQRLRGGTAESRYDHVFASHRGMYPGSHFLCVEHGILASGKYADPHDAEARLFQDDVFDRFVDVLE